ncbi:MAG: response regulator [Gammaproteobacteria bacterium]|nr:response regulator [Gammaproteobacteria bacterium]
MRNVLLSFLLGLTATLAYAGKLELDAAMAYQVGDRFAVFPAEQHMSFEQAATTPATQWSALPPGGTTLGVITREHWLHLRVQNRATASNWVFTLSNASMRSVEAWLVFSDGRKLKRALGADFPIAINRELWGPSANFMFELKQDESVDLYLQVNHHGVFDVSSSIKPMPLAAKDNALQLGWDMFFYGLLLTLSIIQILLMVLNRESTHTFYLLFLISVQFFFLFLDGYLFMLLNSHIEMALAIGQLSLVVASMFALLYMVRFIHVQQISKPLNLFVGCLVLVDLIWIVARIWVDPAYYIQGAMALMLFQSVLILLVSGYFGWFASNQYARYFFLAWLIWCGVCLYTIVGIFGLIDISLDSRWTIFKVGIVLHFVVMSWFSSVRFYQLRHEHEKIVARDEAKSRLLAKVSHEMRTPLNGIIGVSNMLTEHLPDEAARKLNRIIKSCGASLLNLVNDLLEMSNLNSREFILQKTNVDIHGLLHETWELASVQMQDKKLTGELIIADDVPNFVMTDGERVKQVVANLLDNAVKFTHHGNIKMLVECESNTLLIAVKDSGRGIAQKDISRLLEPFEKVMMSAPERVDGAGLGLHISNEIITRLKGRIAIESELNKGTSIYVSIPFESAQLNATTLPSGETMKQPYRELNILAAEDNTVNFLVLKSIINKLGHSLHHVVNGQEAFEYFVQHHEEIDLVLMDCEMPVLDGYQSTKMIRDYELKNKLPRKLILAVTAHVFEEHFNKVIEIGMDDQINKPYSDHDINETIDKYFGSGAN